MTEQATHTPLKLRTLPSPIGDWTGAHTIIFSEECPGGVAAIIGGADHYAEFIVRACNSHYDLLAALKTMANGYHLIGQSQSETGAHTAATFMTCPNGRCPEARNVVTRAEKGE